MIELAGKVQYLENRGVKKPITSRKQFVFSLENQQEGKIGKVKKFTIRAAKKDKTNAIGPKEYPVLKITMKTAPRIDTDTSTSLSILHNLSNLGDLYISEKYIQFFLENWFNASVLGKKQENLQLKNGRLVGYFILNGAGKLELLSEENIENIIFFKTMEDINE